MFKIKSLTQILLSAFLIRILVFGASIGDAIAISALAGLNGFWMYLEFKKVPEPNKEIKDKLIEMEERVSSVQNKVGALGLRR
jgi:hypothetical protein